MYETVASTTEKNKPGEEREGASGKGNAGLNKWPR